MSYNAIISGYSILNYPATKWERDSYQWGISATTISTDDRPDSTDADEFPDKTDRASGQGKGLLMSREAPLPKVNYFLL